MAGIFDNHNWCWSVVGIRGSLYNVLHCFVNQAGGTGVISKMTERLIAERCNITRETARQHARQLEKLGFIGRERRTDANGKQVANGFRLNRDRLFPKESDAYPGERRGQTIWKSLLSQLTSLRGRENTYLLKSQIRDVYFDASQRKTRDGRLKGFLYLVAETDAINSESFKREHVRWLKRLRVEGYHITYFVLLHRIRFDR